MTEKLTADERGHMVDAALQHGFELLDDDAMIYRAREEDIVSLLTGAKTQIDQMRAQLHRARQLCGVCADWNLDEVEIDGEMIDVRDLERQFTEATNA